MVTGRSTRMVIVVLRLTVSDGKGHQLSHPRPRSEGPTFKVNPFNEEEGHGVKELII